VRKTLSIAITKYPGLRYLKERSLVLAHESEVWEAEERVVMYGGFAASTHGGELQGHEMCVEEKEHRGNFAL
jgi:hypothetical protein